MVNSHAKKLPLDDFVQLQFGVDKVAAKGRDDGTNQTHNGFQDVVGAKHGALGDQKEIA